MCRPCRINFPPLYYDTLPLLYRILGGVVKSFLSSVVADMESEMSASDFQNDPLVQKCVVLQDKLASLIANLKAHSDLTRETPPTQKTFVQRDVLMARANSLKKAITGVIDVTEKGDSDYI